MSFPLLIVHWKNGLLDHLHGSQNVQVGHPHFPQNWLESISKMVNWKIQMCKRHHFWLLCWWKSCRFSLKIIHPEQSCFENWKFPDELVLIRAKIWSILSQICPGFFSGKEGPASLEKYYSIHLWMCLKCLCDLSRMHCSSPFVLFQIIQNENSSTHFKEVASPSSSSSSSSSPEASPSQSEKPSHPTLHRSGSHFCIADHEPIVLTDTPNHCQHCQGTLQKLTEVSEINMTLAGCGFLCTYYLGVYETLKNHGGEIFRKIRRWGGASAGSIAASLIVCHPENPWVINDLRNIL